VECTKTWGRPRGGVGAVRGPIGQGHPPGKITKGGNGNRKPETLLGVQEQKAYMKNYQGSQVLVRGVKWEKQTYGDDLRNPSGNKRKHSAPGTEQDNDECQERMWTLDCVLCGHSSTNKKVAKANLVKNAK